MNKINSLSIIYFSPTGTTKKVVDSIQQGMDIEEVQLIDLTLLRDREGASIYLNGDIVIIAIPVYKGGIPKLLKSYLESIKGKGKPTILVSVYGNVNSGSALQELQEICSKVNLITIAAASFIGEHSFSTEELKIAKNRPNKKDLEMAVTFGEKIMKKLISLDDLNQGRIVLPKIKKSLRDKIIPSKGPSMLTYVSDINEDKCNNCKKCSNNCPVDAIDKKTLKVDNKKCIRCMRCVKQCPTNAKKIMFTNKYIKYIVFRKASKIDKKIKAYI